MPAFADYENPAYNRGLEHMAGRNYDSAILDFGEAIGLSETNPKNYIARGKCFFCMHNYDLAIQDFDKSLQYAPNNSEAFLWRGTAHANLGKDAFAIKDYEQAIRLDPKLADKYFSQPESQRTPKQSYNRRQQLVNGVPVENSGMNINAINDYKQAMARLYHKDGKGAIAVADNDANSDQGDDDQDKSTAPIRHVRALQSNPGADLHTDTLNNADMASDQSIRPARNERLSDSLDTDPNRGEFGPPKGTLQFRGDPKKRIESMNDAIANDGNNPELFYKRAKAYQKLMNVAKAMSDYNDAIRLGPNNSKYYLGRASLFNQLQKASLVQADVERARRCNPDLPKVITFQGDPFPESVVRSASVPDFN